MIVTLKQHTESTRRDSDVTEQKVSGDMNLTGVLQPLVVNIITKTNTKKMILTK